MVEVEGLRTGLRELEVLSRVEYIEPLSKVANEGDAQERLDRIGRLIGITLKEPLATPQIVDEPSERTRAYRRWDLDARFRVDPAEIQREVQDTWQYRTLAALQQDEEVIKSRGWASPPPVTVLVTDAQSESGFFSYLTVSCRKYLCQDRELREEISSEVEQVKRTTGLDVRSVTPEMLIASGGVAIGTSLVQSIPILAFVGTPVIAGLVLIIYKIGMEAFCQWALGGELPRLGRGKEPAELE